MPRRLDLPLERADRSESLPFSPQTGRRLVTLMMARLALTLLAFGLALLLDGLGERPGLSEAARSGLFWTLSGAFLAMALTGLALRHIRRPRLFATVQLGIDISVVTSLVFFSGGHESVFSFLYVAIAAYGALLLERRGAFVAAAGCALGYGVVLIAERAAWAAGIAVAGPPAHGAIAIATWGVHVAAFFLVGALGSVLTSELRRTGAALDRTTHTVRRLRNLNEHIVRSLVSGLLTTDAAGRIGSFNPEAERITGVAAIDVIGAGVDEVLPGAWELLTARGGEGLEPVRRTRLAYQHASGASLFLGLAGSALRDADGLSVGHVLIFQDVTEVVQMETRLRQGERLAAVGEMAAKIAHEIRNPLAAISGSVQILRDDGPPQPGRSQEEPRKLMDIVVREADRLNVLITDFLDYARPKPVRRELVRLDELIRDLIEVMRGSCPEEVVLATECEPGLALEADPDQLRQLLWNLCANALQAMPDGGRLCVGARTAPKSPQGAARADRSGEADATACESRAVEIVVEDTGLGIDEETMERLFEPFFTTKAGGTGLGLAMVHRIVEVHAGELDVETALGRGTCFRVTLPRGEGGT